MRYELPLSKAMGKIRIKERLTFGDYGKAVPPHADDNHAQALHRVANWL